MTNVKEKSLANLMGPKPREEHVAEGSVIDHEPHDDPELQALKNPWKASDQKKGRDSLLWESRKSFDSGSLTRARNIGSYKEEPRLPKDFWKSNVGLLPRYAPIRSTALQRYRECPRKFLFTERLGLVSLGYQQAVEIGTSFHRLMAPLYQGIAPENLGVWVADRVRELYTELEKTVGPGGELPGGRDIEEMVAKIEKDAKLAVAMVEVFTSCNPPSEILEGYEVVSVEKTYALKVDRIRTPIVIQPDVLLFNPTSKDYWIMDHKTCSVPPSQRAATLSWEFQPRLYAFVLHHWLRARDPEAKIGGWIHNIIRKPTIRQRTSRQAESFEAYIRRVHEWYTDQLKLYPEDPPILQSAVSAHHVFTEDLLVQIYQAARACTAHLDLGRYYQDASACFGPFKNSPCPFLGICQERNPREWPKLIQANFKQEFRAYEDNR